MNASYLPRLRVIKVGGSLLTWPDLRKALPNWLNTLSPATNLIIFGGGECIEAMRDLDAIWKLEPTAMHWRCVRLLDATCEIAHELWPNWKLLPNRTFPELPSQQLPMLKQLLTENRDTTQNFIVQVSAIYIRDDDVLPQSWATTTDSIAAFLAAETGAFELILLKSTTPKPFTSLYELSQTGFVDAAFSRIAPRDCRILTVDFTSSRQPETVLQEPKTGISPEVAPASE